VAVTVPTPLGSDPFVVGIDVPLHPCRLEVAGRGYLLYPYYPSRRVGRSPPGSGADAGRRRVATSGPGTVAVLDRYLLDAETPRGDR
jgi:hypothetical protein